MRDAMKVAEEEGRIGSLEFNQVTLAIGNRISERERIHGSYVHLHKKRLSEVI